MAPELFILLIMAAFAAGVLFERASASREQ